MADRPVRPRHRPGAKRIDPEPVEPTDTTKPDEAKVPRPRRTPDPSETWRLRPRGLVAHEVRDRWNEAQGEFVDDPPHSVREADALASEVADAVIAEIEARRAALRSAWNGTEPDTEALRLALREYRSFVKQLVGEG